MAKMRPVRSAVLISGSPRRRAILSTFVTKLTIIVPKVQEPPVRIKKDLLVNARLKFWSVTAPKADLVLAADTAVFIDGKALGKPKTPAEATRMLRRLSGRWHEVLTAMVLLIDKKKCTAVVTTKVHFRKLPQTVIAAYIATGEPLDKAGAYGIQGIGGLFIDRIDGDYYNVVGLPLPRLEELLEKNGLNLIRKMRKRKKGPK